MKKSRKNFIRRVVALILVAAMGCISPMNSMSEKTADAASSKKMYVGDVKLFIKEGGSEEDAQSWCDAQDANKDEDETNDWEVVPGNLNEGASGALKKDVSVFLCYQKTPDVSKAVTDMAVMNEKGNYSEGAYEQILNDQRDLYKDMVNDLKSMLEEYRTNYNNNVQTAVQAHDFMNGYIEDDSGKRFGDFLLDASDEDLVEVFLQANGQVVIMMQEQLAFACDTHATTWLDRMEQLGSYNTLRNQYIKAYNKNTAKADKALKTKYQEKALKILESWDDIHQHVEKVRKYYEQTGMEEMSDEELVEMADDWEKNTEDGEIDTDYYMFIQEIQTLSGLAVYSYEGETLLEYFSQSYEDVSGDNINKLYPLAACLTEGQMAAINETISLYSILMDALSATALNDTGKGKAAELMRKADEEDKKELEEYKEELEADVKEMQDIPPISVYNGVDRGVFEGGVAVTSTAENYSAGDESNWANTFVESGDFTKAAIGMAAGSVVCAGAAVAFAVIARRLVSEQVIENNIVRLLHITRQGGNNAMRVGLANYSSTAQRFGLESYRRLQESLDTLDVELQFGGVTQQQAQSLRNLSEEVTTKAGTMARSQMSYKLMQGLKIGFAVVCVLLAIADIVMTVVALYKYYNVDHIPIPNYMVDLSYNDDKETSYISYKSVHDQNDKNGDLNGGGGKQWLALYATHDRDAGDPILAPGNKGHDIVVQKKNNAAPDGYSPLHLFGQPNASQNLTFADGENGWSYNDKAGGIYLFFGRDANAFFAIGDDEEQAGTVFSTGKVVLFTGLGTILGLLIGGFGTFFFVKKKEKTVKV